MTIPTPQQAPGPILSDERILEIAAPFLSDGEGFLRKPELFEVVALCRAIVAEVAAVPGKEPVAGSKHIPAEAFREGWVAAPVGEVVAVTGLAKLPQYQHNLARWYLADDVERLFAALPPQAPTAQRGSPLLPLRIVLQSGINGVTWSATCNKTDRMFIDHLTPDAAVRAVMDYFAADQATSAVPRRPLVGCAAGRDGDCTHPDCPQLRDNEPKATGRHCPLDTSSEED